MPATCTQCPTPATHGYRPPSTPANREPDFEPRCDAHGYSRDAADVVAEWDRKLSRPSRSLAEIAAGPKRRLSGLALGMIVALVRRLSSVCTAEGASITVTVTPDGAVVRFDGDVTPDHIAARPGPDGWRYLDIEGVPVSVSWMQP